MDSMHIGTQALISMFFLVVRDGVYSDLYVFVQFEAV